MTECTCYIADGKVSLASLTACPEHGVGNLRLLMTRAKQEIRRTRAVRAHAARVEARMARLRVGVLDALDWILVHGMEMTPAEIESALKRLRGKVNGEKT